MAAQPLDYGSYLQLSQLLDCQHPQSARHGRQAHDEMLFIIVHQAYELWFKQILHEMDRIELAFAAAHVDEHKVLDIVRALERVVTVLRLLVQQLDVLESMTPLDFLDFRDLLSTASGFQSLQFRLIETRLGLPEAARLLFGEASAEEQMAERDRARVAAARGGTPLLRALDSWLARMPFVAGGDYAFESAYRDAVETMLAREIGRVRDEPGLAPQRRVREIEAIEQARTAFGAIFSPQAPADAWRMSLKAVRAALFIMLYRDMPALQLPFRLLAAVMDIDETLTIWRYRHALMVERMIGVKTGTGGSSGHVYLRRTAETHRVFTDLFQLSTFLIPRSAVPPLPPELARRLSFVYMAENPA
ncbi:MAG: tryptophan 2,3-dioxygenase [Proteobacteria bacterium]|nr:tryptophan 2,3-dioxygenase [Pseudomonadota bacterium]